MVDAGPAVSGPVNRSERLNAEVRPSVSVVEAWFVGLSAGIESSAMPARTPRVRLIPIRTRPPGLHIITGFSLC